jgi:dihydrofolate reductase
LQQIQGIREIEEAMSKLVVFNQVSLDGYFTDANGDISWAHKGDDPEWNAFVSDNAQSGGMLLFGRITYEMMVAFWPTPQAIKTMPAVARPMNERPKIVFSRTLNKADWNNTRIVKGKLADEIRKLKKDSGMDMAILGSGSIIAQLAPAGVIDEYQVVVNPIILGSGRTMFEGVEKKVDLRLTRSRAFANGNILMVYEPAGKRS